jgi:serine/threonine protein kinase
VLASLQHPNIVSCVESFVERGQLCIVMDYCAGGDLHQLVKRQRGRCGVALVSVGLSPSLSRALSARRSSAEEQRLRLSRPVTSAGSALPSCTTTLVTVHTYRTIVAAAADTAIPFAARTPHQKPAVSLQTSKQAAPW